MGQNQSDGAGGGGGGGAAGKKKGKKGSISMPAGNHTLQPHHDNPSKSNSRSGQGGASPNRPPSPRPSSLQPEKTPPAHQQHPSPSTQPAQPLFDENSHPFHAPLDHVREEERPLQELAAATHFDITTLRQLQAIFTDIAESDVDDGIIDGNELTDAMGLKPSSLLARTIFRLFDFTFQRKIDFAMWVKTISALSPEASLEEKIKFSFSLYDLNGDGSIDLEELRAMLEAAVKDENVLHLSDEEVKDLCDYTLSAVDRDGNGSVDYEEYRSMVKNSVKFLESFTLDIHALCSTFRFKGRREGSMEKLTAHEVDQRLLWFRARQKQYAELNHSESEKTNSSSQDGSEHENHHHSSDQSSQQPSVSPLTPARAADSSTPSLAQKTASGRKPTSTGSGTTLHKPITVAVAPPPASSSTTPGSVAVAAATAGANPNASGLTVPVGQNLNPFSATRGAGAGFNRGTDTDAYENSPLGSQYEHSTGPPNFVASSSSNSATSAHSNHSSASTSAVKQTEDSNIQAGEAREAVNAAVNAAILALPDSTPVPSDSSQPPNFHESQSPPASASSIPNVVLHSETRSNDGHPLARKLGSHPHSMEERNAAAALVAAEAAAAAGASDSSTSSPKILSAEKEAMLRQNSAPTPSSKPRSVHAVAASTPAHLLRMASVATLQTRDEIGEEDDDI